MFLLHDIFRHTKGVFTMLTTILVCILAGLGAGLGTGFAGMSAAAVISPMLITFLGMDPYHGGGHRAILVMFSQVRVSAYTYHKNKNLDIRNGLIMMVSVTVIYRHWKLCVTSGSICGNTMGGLF